MDVKSSLWLFTYPNHAVWTVFTHLGTPIPGQPDQDSWPHQMDNNRPGVEPLALYEADVCAKLVLFQTCITELSGKKKKGHF